MNILKNKRGIVLENAIIFMLVIFALCFVLTTITLTNYYQARIDLIKLENKIQVDQIGEDFLKSIADHTEFTQTYDGYLYTCSDNDDGTFTLTVTQQNTTKLDVKAKIIDGQVQVICWNYE